MRLRVRILLLFVALFGVVSVDFTVDGIIEHNRDRSRSVIDKELVPGRTALDELTTSLVDQETGERGFLLTGKPEFLEPYTTGKRQSQALLARLQQLFAGDNDTLAAIDRVQSRVDAWQQLAAGFEIDAKQQGREGLVTALVSSGTGKQLFDRVRAEIADTQSLLDRRVAAQQRHVRDVGRRLDLLRLVGVLLSLLVIGWTGRLVIRWVTVPLRQLGAAVRHTAAGALREPIPAPGPPDIAELGVDVDAMRRRLLAEIDDAARARAALADRGMIVVTLRDDLAPAIPDLPSGVAVAGRFRPAKGLVAGDWYDVLRVNDDRIAMALIDVSGHGAEVATFALRTKALTMAAIASHGPGAAFAWLSNHLGDTGELFLTGVIIELSASSGEVRYASAGHPPLLLAGVTGVTELPPTGPLLGPLAGRWDTETAQLERGGVLLAYSDGLVEARNVEGKQFGIERAAALLAQHQLGGVAEVADATVAAVEQFAAEGGRDDVTLCVLGR